jgi:cytoskeletal protein CcmA (bactofilin family)
MLWEKKPRSTSTGDPEVLPQLSVTSGDLKGTPVQHETPKTEEPMTENLQRPITPTPTSGSRVQTVLGQGVLVKGDLSGKEDLLIEGECEGTLNFQDHCLTIGPASQVKSEIHARQVVVHGTVNGRISAKDRVEIRKTGTVVGDIVSAGVAIEDGAYFKGSIEIIREGQSKVTRAASAVA